LRMRNESGMTPMKIPKQAETPFMLKGISQFARFKASDSHSLH
jgi:hypothetical protein